jgi:hypothetical protein
MINEVATKANHNMSSQMIYTLKKFLTLFWNFTIHELPRQQLQKTLFFESFANTEMNL